jgi:hypothetical protein
MKDENNNSFSVSDLDEKTKGKIQREAKST